MIKTEISPAICEENYMEIELEAADIKQLLQAIAGKNSDFKQNVFDQEGELYSHILIFINNTDYRSLGGLEYKVTPEDSVKILSLLGGG